MDEDINMQWVQGTLIPGIGNDQEDKVLLCFQKSQTFHKICRNQMTQWVRKVWSELSNHEIFFKRLFKKTGCLLSQQMVLMM